MAMVLMCWRPRWAILWQRGSDIYCASDMCAMKRLWGYWAIQRSWFARVNAFCNLSRKKSQEVAAHFRADFWVGVASGCVKQWTLNLESRSSTNANTVAVAKITVERGWRVGKKSVFAFFVCFFVCLFFLTRRSRVGRTNAFWGILQHEQQVIAYCQTHYDYGPPKMPLKLAV